MPDIFQDSLTEKIGLPEVEVLLATLNGAEFIGQFLQSLSEQKAVKIHLRISDDGSTDQTIDIIQSFRDRFESLEIACGPKEGPCNNFLFLINRSTHQFMALADQDDIWHSDHLSNSIERMKSYLNKPVLSYSSVLEISQSKRQVWPNNEQQPNLVNSIFENSARGCTIVLNDKTRDLINLHQPKKAVMHDWWIYLLVQFCGVVVFSSKPEVDYRLHGNNFVGARKRWLSRALTFIKGSSNPEWPPRSQLIELLDNYAGYLDSEKHLIVLEVAQILTSSRKERLFWLMRNKIKLRKSWVEDLAVKIRILTLK